jgi:hypothetical protein
MRADAWLAIAGMRGFAQGKTHAQQETKNKIGAFLKSFDKSK